MQSKSLLVFPTSRAIRNHVTHDSSNRLLIPHLSIDDFFLKSITIGHCSFIDEEHRFLLLKEATDIKNFNALGISNNFNDFIKQSEYIFRFFNELSAENIAFDAIKKADTYEFYEEHLSLLEAIYTRYCSLLEENNYVDKITLPKKYQLNHDFLENFEQITLFFEGYFTHFEFSLITQIAQKIPLHIHLHTNRYNKKSYEKFIHYGFDLKEDYHYILDMTGLTILQATPLKKPIQNVDIKGFSLRINQIAFVKKAITTMIEKGIASDDIVVIVPDENFVQSLQLFDTHSYFNYAMGKDIKTSTLYTKAFALYQYLNEFEQKEKEYLTFLKLDYLFIQETFYPIWNKTITPELFTTLTAYLKTEETHQELIEKFEEECYKLHQLLFNYKEPITFKEAYKFLLQRISSLSLDDVNGGAITVMGLLETRGLSFKGVIIVDFNEEIVPKKSIKDKFLSTHVKKHANLPTRKDRENLQKYYYYTLCKEAQEVCIGYVKNETQSISRFAAELFDTSIDSNLYDSSYQPILYTSKSLKHFNEAIILDMDLSSLQWSASSLKTYLHCKRKYYLKHIASIKEHHFSLKPQNFEMGTAIHTVLEHFYSEYSRCEPSMSNTILNPYFKSIQKNNPFMLLDFEVWKRKLERVIENEKQEFTYKAKKVFKTEMPFKFNFCDITLKGVIDRVDKGDNFFEIIDYKTSSALKVDTLKTYEKSVDFQLEFYFLAMKNYLKEHKICDMKITPYYYDLNHAVLLEEIVLSEKLELLEEKLKTLKTTTVNFEKCDDKTVCSYCPYTTICER
ncbi:MAG: PD-(D/E)XK nuclease family protein [Sulfurimonadaceae bacterium]